MNIALIGFGVVGQGFVEALHKKSMQLQDEHSFSAQVVAVTTRSRGALYHPDGLDLQALLETGGGPLADYPDTDGLQRDLSTMQIITESNAHVIVELAYSNLETGQPAIDHVKAAFNASKHVVLANKGPVALAFAELNALAAEKGVQFLYEATVMAGTPSLQLAQQAMRGTTIFSVRGILNGTTNYILTRMEAGMPYAAALAESQEKGYAEADPTADVDGWDAAGKVLILAGALFGKTLTFDDMDVQGIAHLMPEDIETAAAAGERYKLIAEATPDGGSVKPVRLPVSNPLAGVGGATNAITLSTDLMGDVTLIGAGAGKLETGFAILSDILLIHDRTK
ncbi:MAG: homoserine dehydrogenase [Chloroflexota bacterium]